MDDLFPIQNDNNMIPQQQNYQPKRQIQAPQPIQKQTITKPRGFQKKIVNDQNVFVQQTPMKKPEKRYKKYENNTFKILSFGIPRPCVKYQNKRYEIEVAYLSSDAKKHKMTIAFGNKEAKDYIDHKDKNKRSLAISKLQHGDNPFHANFYKVNILNGQHTNIFDNFKELCMNNDLC